MSVARARLLAGVGRGLLVQEASRILTARRRGPTDGSGPTAEQLWAVAVREAFEALGPLYVKVGQILSTRPDIVPATIAAELECLHDRVPALAFAEMEPVLAEALGAGWRGNFRDFDTEHPLGSASLAQVYGATLADGTPAAVKIQRPGIRSTVEEDMRMLRRFGRFVAGRAPIFNAVIDIDAMIGVIFDAIRPELDFVLEAGNMDHARASARDFDLVSVPEVLEATPKVLVQSLAEGSSIRDADRTRFKEEERVETGRQILAFMYRGYFTDLTFHADPHPGNIFVAPGGPATLIDWGMVGRIDRRLGMSLMLALLSLSQNDGRALAKAWIEMGRATPWADVSAFAQDMMALVPRITSASLAELDFGATFTSVLTHSSRRGIQTSPMVSILGKSFANAEGSVRYLAPELSVTDIFRDEMRDIVFAYAREALSEQQAARVAMELVIGAHSSAGEVRGLLRDLSNQDFTVQVGTALKQRISPIDDRADARAMRTLAAAALGALIWERARARRRR